MGANGSAIVPRQATPAATASPVSGASAGAAERVTLPPSERRYLAGRVMAVLMQVVGWLLVVLGVALAGLAVVAGGAPAVPVVGSTAGAAAGLVVVGCVLVFWGQVARAIFDGANAARDLVAIERARAERGGKG